MFPKHVERGQIFSLTTLGWRRSRRSRRPRARNKNGVHWTSQRLIRKIMLSKLFSSVCGSNEGLRRITLTMPHSISQSRCSKVSEKMTQWNYVLLLLKSGSEVAQKAATASSSTASMHVASYNQISWRKKRNIIDLMTLCCLYQTNLNNQSLR